MRISDWSSDVCSSDLVFSANGKFYLTHVGFDGIGYQTGICESDDLINWRRLGVIMARDPDDPITRYNIACASILRENGLQSPERLDRKSVVSGKSVSVRVDLGGRRIIKKKKEN